MAAFTGNGYLVADLAALKSIPAADRPAFKVAVLVAGLGWYEYDNTATSGGIIPNDSPASGRWFPIGREVLRANRTYFVRTDGNDNNTGLVNTSGGAFLTIQKAIDVVASLDISIFDVTIQVANGTYTSATPINLKKLIGSGRCVIQGDTTTPTNVTLNGTNNGFFAREINSTYEIKGFRIIGGDAVYCFGSGVIELGNNNFGACSSVHIATENGGRININTSFSISGGAIYSLYSVNATINGTGSTGKVCTLTGTPAFTTFAYCSNQGYMQIPNTYLTFSGGATGSRYNVSAGALLQTFGSGANYFPGNSAGTIAPGGQYL